MTYTINESCEISFDPLSQDFAERVNVTFSELFDIYHHDFVNSHRKNPFDLDREFRLRIDALFDEPVCEKVFGDTNVLLTAGGSPLWFNFMHMIIDEIDRSITEGRKILRPHIPCMKNTRKQDKSASRKKGR